MSTLLALVCGVVALLSAVQAQLQCPSLIAAAQSSVSPSCSAHSDCRGLVCANSNLGWNVTLTVQPCTDPVVVDVSVLTTANGNTVSFDFTQVGQQQQQQGNIAINLLRYRNASHIFVQLTSSSSDILIPPLYIPLNPGVCMCHSVESIIASAPNTATCEKNANCTGAVCTSTFASFFTVKMYGNIRPCTVPPSLEMSMTGPNNQPFFKRSFTHSELANVSIPGLDFPGFSNTRLNVTLIEHEYSEIMQVDFLYSSSVVTVVPRQQVILDKTGCTPPTPTPTQPGSPFTAATCARLQKTAANTGIIFTCSVEDGCTGLTCHGLNHRMDLTIIPCNTPPAFNVMLFNSSNALIYNKNITNQTTIPVVEGIGIRVQVKESQDGVKLKANLDPTNTAIIPYTDIPLNRCQCTNIFCNYTSSSSLPPSQAPPTITRSQPTSTPKTSPQTGSSSSVLVISISVPVLVVVAILAVTVGILVGVFVRRYFRSQRRFTFQQMSAIKGDGEDDDDE